MKGIEVVNLFQTGIKPVVRFNKLIEETEIDFDNGMMTHLIEAIDKNDGTVKVVFDFSEFEEHNIPFMKANYWDENNQPTLRWIDTNYYPKDKRVCFYIDTDQEIPFEVLNNNVAFNAYQQSGSKLSYVQWLEEQYLMKR